MKQNLPFEYICLAALRALSTLFTQNGYIHPDEFFQTTEIVLGDVFGVVHNRPWEFNTNFPVRSICLLYSIFAMPLSTTDWILRSHNIYAIWEPDLSLLFFRLITCAISFITDYSIFKICKLLRLKSYKHLLLISSSYVIIVFATKTFTNSFELALVSLLLWKVVESMIITEKVLIATKEIENTISCETLTDKILRIRALKKLPSHHYINVLEISTILVLGIFNRPTFVLFAVTPLFFWITRGFNEDFNKIYIRLILRILILLLCIVPGVFLFTVIDSFYYGYITRDEWNLTITPLNFIIYNINSSNLAKHGLHFRGIHALINIPILFNILTLFFLHNLQLPAFIHNFTNRQYHLLPNMFTVKTLMVANVIIPLFLLSIFPHQESRFLLPLILPIVFCTAKFFSGTYLNHFKYILPIWCFSNIIGLIFYGYLHQAGVTPMVSYLFRDIQNVSKVHIIHSHTYPIPVGLLMVPRFNKNITYTTQRSIKVHDLGSSLDPEVLYDTVMNIKKNITRSDSAVYFALTGALSKQFEYVCNISSFRYTKQQFFPHISMESLGYYLTSIIDLFYYDENKSSFISLGELGRIFSLVLYKIT